MYSLPFKPVLFGLTLLISNICLAEEPQILTLDQAVAQLKQQNPAVAARKQAADALAFQPTQLASLPDPVLSFGALNLPTDSFSRKQEAMSQLQIGISQTLPFPGKLSLEAEANKHIAQAAVDDMDEFVLQQARRVKTYWWSVFYLDRALEAVMHNQVLLRQLIRIAESKYKVGKGLQQDVLLAQLELSKLLDHNIQLDAMRKQETIRLNTLLNRSAQSPILLPKRMDEMLYVVDDEQDLMAVALQMRPRLVKQEKLIAAAESRLSLADKAYYPDFKLGATYGLRAEDPATGLDRADLASVTMSMTLPFFTSGKQNAQMGQRQAERARAQFQYLDIKNEVVSEIHSALTSYERAKAQSTLFKTGIIPQAKQTVASMMAAYQVNKVDFLNLVRAQVTLYNYETQYWKVFAEAKQALAHLGAAVGKDISDE